MLPTTQFLGFYKIPRQEPAVRRAGVEDPEHPLGSERGTAPFACCSELSPVGVPARTEAAKLGQPDSQALLVTTGT